MKRNKRLIDSAKEAGPWLDFALVAVILIAAVFTLCVAGFLGEGKPVSQPSAEMKP